MNGDEVAFLSIRELGALLRKGYLSPVELTNLYLSRLDGIGRAIKAVVTSPTTSPCAKPGLPRPRLQAVSTADRCTAFLMALKTLLRRWAHRRHGARRRSATSSSHRKRRLCGSLRDAGAVLAAKLDTIEIAGGMGYDNPDASIDRRRPSNPWNASRWTSGSSSGPAGAVAAAAVPFAIGSDTSGSILFPAAFTGVAGLRATYGRVSRFGAMTLCWTLDQTRADVPIRRRLRTRVWKRLRVATSLIRPVLSEIPVQER